MKRKTSVIVVGALLTLAVSTLLAACASSVTASSVPTAQNTDASPTSAPTETIPDAEQPTAGSNAAQSDLTRTDAQGMVEVTVRPVNLVSGGQTLDFEISMDTHSVDLSMDLAGLATLTTDTGKTVDPKTWDAPRGGHHVSGTLSFPAQLSGIALLDGAKRLTLTIRGVDIPERVFVWELGS